MRGQVYSIIAVLIVIPIFLFTTQYLTASQTIRQEISEKIVADQLHHLESSIEQDFVRALDISGKRALLAAANWIIANGSGLNNAELRLRELMENGTLYDNVSFLMENNTLQEWRNRILALKTGFNTDLSYSNLTIANSDGFNLNTSLVLNITVSDNLGIARITKNNLKKTTLISVGDLEDPVFPLNTAGFVRRVVQSSPLSYSTKILVNGTTSYGNCSGNVSFDKYAPDSEKILVTNNASGVSGFRGVAAETTDIPSVSCYVIGASNAVNIINNSINQTNYSMVYLDNTTSSPLAVWHLLINKGLENKYYYSGNGPDFLKRLEGDLNSLTNGLETFVNIPELQQAGIPTYDYSRIDYLYFSKNNTISYKVKGLPDWFKIDSVNANKYNLTELLIT